VHHQQSLQSFLRPGTDFGSPRANALMRQILAAPVTCQSLAREVHSVPRETIRRFIGRKIPVNRLRNAPDQFVCARKAIF